jgi:pimeloyl-ACP methyl ester carboxylesterase
MNKSKITFTQSGSGKKIILIHGYGGSVHHWDTVVPLLNTNFNVIVPNMTHLFMGKEAISFSKQIDQLADFLRENWRGQKFHFCGLSYGAAIVWGLSLRYPEMVEKVIFINPMPPKPIEFFNWGIVKMVLAFPIPAFIMRLLFMTVIGKHFFKTATHIFRAEREHYKDRSYNLKGRKLDFLTHITHRFSWICRNENWSYWRDRMDQWIHPAMLIYDVKDPLFRNFSHEVFAEWFSCDYVVNLKGYGHIMTLENGPKVSEYINEFLDGSLSKIFQRRAS